MKWMINKNKTSWKNEKYVLSNESNKIMDYIIIIIIWYEYMYLLSLKENTTWMDMKKK